MAIDMGESLMHTYLKHIKKCKIVQTNWKVSSEWEEDDSDTSECFLRCQQLEGVFYKQTLQETTQSSDDYDQYECDDIIKVGILANVELRKILEQYSSKELLSDLQDAEYSKNQFGLHRAVLTACRTNDNKDRYYKKLLKILGTEYYLCNDWYERNRQPLLGWIDVFTKSQEDKLK